MRYVYGRSKIGNQSGAVAVSVAILMILMVGFAALAIDVGYLMATRNELQNVADAAALAATRQLGENYRTMSYTEQLGYDCDSSGVYPCSQIIDIAQQVGLDNKAAQVNIAIDGNDIKIGQWAAGVFTAGTAQPDAVRVTARRDDTSNNPITTFLAGVFGPDTLTVTAQATAALTGQSSVEEGDLELPIGISEAWLERGDACSQPIRFAPANSPYSCAGWTSWEEKTNDPALRDILDLDEPKLSPALRTGDQTNFSGGQLSTQVFDALDTLFQHRGYDVYTEGGDPPLGYDDEGNPIPVLLDPPDGVEICEKNADDPDDPEDPDWKNFHPCDDTHTTPLLYPDGTAKNLHEWQTKVVVYGSDSCENPNQTYEIVGFVDILLTEVVNSPDKSVVGRIICEKKDTGVSRGGGAEYGTKGSIPQLVQ